jgi:DMSO/TMAO reductase YedYZ molybdopterin-dependent catalytic subunit
MDQPRVNEPHGRHIDRRTLLREAAAVAPLLCAPGVLSAAQQPGGSPRSEPLFPGQIIRQQQPDNLEFPFPTLDSFLTPTNRFFVRSHFAVPALSAQTWRLRVEGAVNHPLELTFEEIRSMAPRTEAALLECAGNNRVFIVPQAAGLLWELGAVSTAEWTGVPLTAVLDRAGVRTSAVEVIFEGHDRGEARAFPNPFSSPGEIPYARSLPLAKARRPEVLLAYRMNGADLPPAHGYPLRLVVPGWYGMASVKWLRRLIITERPFAGFHQTMEYAYYERQHGLPSLTPLTELQVKAQIARPMLHEQVPANRPYRVHGAAWTGESEVTRVEVSTDGGQSWGSAPLLQQHVPFAWRFWEYTWTNPARGRHVLMARATDRRGRTQPTQRDPDRRNVMISHVLPIPVEVR